MNQLSQRNGIRLSTTQAAVIIINYTLGAGILTLPRTTTKAVGTPDVWLSMLLSSIVIWVMGFIVVKLCQRYPGETFFEFTPKIVGKWLAIPLGLSVIFYFLLISAFEIRIMAEVTGIYLLEGTPDWGIVMVFIWIGYYLIAGGLNAITRLFEIILPLTLIFFVIVMLMSLKIFDLNNLRPVLGQGMMPVFHGMKSTLLAFTGYEIMFVVMAFMNQPKRGSKSLTGALLVSAGIYLITIIMVVGGLSVEGVLNKTFPTLDLLRSFELEGLIFERFESLLLVIWIMQIFSTSTITLFAVSLGSAQMTRGKMNLFLFLALPLVYLFAFTPKSEREAFIMGDTLGNASVFLFGLMPLLLLITDMVRKKVRRSR